MFVRVVKVGYIGKKPAGCHGFDNNVSNTSISGRCDMIPASIPPCPPPVLFNRRRNDAKALIVTGNKSKHIVAP